MITLLRYKEQIRLYRYTVLISLFPKALDLKEFYNYTDLLLFFVVFVVVELMNRIYRIFILFKRSFQCKIFLFTRFIKFTVFYTLFYAKIFINFAFTFHTHKHTQHTHTHTYIYIYAYIRTHLSY